MTTKSAARRDQIQRKQAQRSAVLDAGREADHRRTQRRRIIMAAAVVVVLAGIVTATIRSPRQGPSVAPAARPFDPDTRLALRRTIKVQGRTTRTGSDRPGKRTEAP